MPIVVPAVREGSVLQPASVPANSLMVRVSGSSYVYQTEDDLYAPDLARDLGTNVFSGARSVATTFAGMHYHSQVPPIRHGVVRNVDCTGCHWAEIEPASGAFRWQALDDFVATASAAGREVVYCFLATPAWASARPAEAGHYNPGGDAEPADPASLAAFAGAVCSRYRAQGTPIRAFEIWNEPKFDDGGGVAQGNYFTGTPEAMAQMARVVWTAVKAIDPGALVLTPSPTGLEYRWIDGDRSGTDQLHRFLGAADGSGGTGAQWVDAVAFHTYSHDGRNNVHAIPQMFANATACMALHGLAGREMWVTETSAIAPTLFSYVAQHQQEFIARTLLLALGCGAARVVWYALDDPLGFDQKPAVATFWNGLVGVLAGARISVVNALADARVAAVVDGKRCIF
jgi:hypothetical protein